jgi:hypothetical protein
MKCEDGYEWRTTVFQGKLEANHDKPQNRIINATGRE